MTDGRLCLALDVASVDAAVARVRRTSAVFSRAASRAGASMLVIGRALTGAADPDAALARLLMEVRP